MITNTTLKMSDGESIQCPSMSVPTRDRIMKSTMSVDEYFDELIDKVREDYANL